MPVPVLLLQLYNARKMVRNHFALYQCPMACTAVSQVTDLKLAINGEE